MNRSILRRGAVLALTLAALAATAMALWLGVFRDGRAAASPGPVDLYVVVSSNPASGTNMAPGSIIGYMVTVTSDDVTTVGGDGITLAIDLDNAAYVSGSLSVTGGITCDTSGLPIVCDVPDFSGSGSKTVSFDAEVGASGPVLAGAVLDPPIDGISGFGEVDEGALTPDYNDDDGNDDTLSCAAVGEGSDASGEEPDNFDCTSHGVANADLTITKASSPAEGTVGEGSTIIYLLTATNAVGATGTATDIAVRDYIGDGLDFVSVTHGTKVTCGDTDPPEINCTIDSLAPGQSATVTVTVSVEADSGLVLNGAYIDPEDAIAETNEDADDPDQVCGSVGEGTDAGASTEDDNYDCTVHAAAEATPTPTPTPTATATPTPTPTATATPTPTPTATPTAGVLLNCPLVGKWAMSVWDGPSGTATGNALVTCTGITIDAAYSLDRATNNWYRYFPGRTDVNNLLTLNDKQAIIVLGR